MRLLAELYLAIAYGPGLYRSSRIGLTRWWSLRMAIAPRSTARRLRLHV